VTPTITLIVAAAGGVIGRDNAMPWHLPADLAHFKLHTWGKPIVMGRKTFEAIGKPLPGRRNVVVTRDAGWSAAGVTVAHSFDEALAACGDAPEVMVIGGAQLYAAALPRADRIHYTEVHAEIDGDTRFPELDRQRWREVARHEHPADARNAHALSFLTLERVG
jgi:dihydrofolate reductase